MWCSPICRCQPPPSPPAARGYVGVRWWSAVVALYAVLCLVSSRSSRRRGGASSSSEFAPVARLGARAAERVWRLRLLPGLVVELIY